MEDDPPPEDTPMIQKYEPAADAVRTVLIVEDQIEMRAIAAAYLFRPLAWRAACALARITAPD